jgi:hypothetical protein
MFTSSETTAKLDAAIAKAQGEFEAAAKDKINPAFRSKYADLTAVWAAIRPALSKHGIAVTQWPIHSDDGRLHLLTRLAHDGEWMRCEFSIPVAKVDSHGYGSAVTYAKRFALAAAVGVVADDDDDGNAAKNQKPTDTSHLNGTPGASKKDTRPIYKDLIAEMRKAQSVEALKEWLKLRRSDIETLPADWLNHFDEDYNAHKDSLMARQPA